MTRLTAKSLTKDIDQFLVFKHALGYPYRRGEATLRSFQRFATRKLERNATIDLATTIKAWLSRGPNRKPVTRGLELGPVRQLCHFRRRRDPTGYVPSVSLAPQTESHYVPYIFSIEQIRLWLRPPAAIRAVTFGPACCACSFSRLTAPACVLARPFGCDARMWIFARGYCIYARARVALDWFPLERISLASFASTGRSATSCSAQRARSRRRFIHRPLRARDYLEGRLGALRRMLRHLGLKRSSRSHRPTALRSAPCLCRSSTDRVVSRRRGHSCPTSLAVGYMGHVSVLGTETYLHATPELLQFASDRFARRVAA